MLYLLAFWLILLFLTRPRQSLERPQLREVMDAILYSELTAKKLDSGKDETDPSAEISNDFFHSYYWRAEIYGKIAEGASISIGGFIGPGHGTLKISWLDGDVKEWYHNTTPLPNMAVGENFLAYQILETLRVEFNKLP